MSAHRIRSVNAQLTRLSTAAFLVIVLSLVLATLGIDWAVRRFDDSSVPRRTAQVQRLFERQVEETARRAEEHAHSLEAVEVLARSDARLREQVFRTEMVDWLSRYGYTFVAVAGADYRMAQQWTRDRGLRGEAPALPAALYQEVERRQVVSGYLRVGDTPWLIGAGAIRDSSHAKPLGYLVFGLPLDDEHISAMGRELSTRIELSRAGAPGTDDRAASTRIIAGGDSLLLRQPMVDVFGDPIGIIAAAFDRSDLHVLYNFALAGLFVALLVGAVTLGIVYNSGRRLLVGPVRAMAREVEAMRQSRALHEISGDAPAVEWEVLRTTFNQTVRTLHDWQRRYRDVFDRAADALFLIEPSTGRVIDANPATTVLTGVEPATMIGQPLPAELLPTRGPGQRIVRWRRPDGVTQTWGVAASEIQLDGGPWTLAAYRDLTGREAMAHAQKMEAVGSLAGGIAHDFNNLMGAVLTGTAAARALVAPGHPAHTALDGIEHAGQRAADLTRQLLRFSRHDPLRLEPIDVAHVIDSVAAICSRTFDRRISIDTWTAPDLPAVLGDAGELEQALLNLCINARDAMETGGALRMEAMRTFMDAVEARSIGAEPGEYVSITVSDTGSGISDEIKARLFEPFFTTKEPGKGTGLGLSLVYGLMRQIGGSVAIRSAEGKGTQATLYFPALMAPAVRRVSNPARRLTPSASTINAAMAATSTPPTGNPAAPAPPPAPAPARPVVLLIDDEHALREMMRLVLDLSGFEVLEAADGEAGLERFREEQARVRAIILDVQLPGRYSGPDTLAKIRELDREVPVILCTGFVREDELARMRAMQVEDVLLKPVDVNTLVTRLEALAARAPTRASALPAR